jgi:hypothetical protein
MKITRIALVTALIVLSIFANFVVIRYGAKYVIEADFYGKLSAAYDVAGRKGLDNELGKMISGRAGKRQALLAEDFRDNLAGIADVEAFIDRSLEQDKRMVRLLQNLRFWAFTLIVLLLIAKILLGRKPKRE